MLLVSIITPVLNGAATVECAVRSVLEQTYPRIEHIIVDGGSTDGTLDIVGRYAASTVLHEPRPGIYSALNTGISHATGEIVGILSADDLYTDADVINNVADAFLHEDVDSVYGDLCYVDQNDPVKVIRYWQAGVLDKALFKRGWMPPHPALFVKREVYEKYGLFDTRYKIAADYDIILRFLYRHEISAFYLGRVLVNMRWGGMSNKNINNILRKTREDYRIAQAYDLDIGTIVMKNISKVPQFFKRK